MPLAYPRRALGGAAAGLAAACLALSSTAAGAAQADQTRSQEWWLQALHVTRAWQSSRGAGVTVAVLDTGVDPQQPDLSGSVISGPDYTASGRVPDGPYWGLDGTAAASLIAGHGHGPSAGDGIVGVAPAARILAVRVTLESDDPLLADPSIAGALPDAIAHGIRYAVRRHAAVIDLPLDPVPTPGSPGAGGSQAERSAVAYALANHVVLVAPAGDGGQSGDAVNFPAAYPGVISVGAFDSSFIKAAFSSQQPYVTLTAPGSGVIAAQPQGAYTTVDSTTAASAIVAGIAALIRAQFPQLTPAQVEQALIAGTIYHRPGGQADGSGHGTADAAAALAAAARIVEAMPGPAASASPAASAAQAPTPPAVHTPAGPSLGLMIRDDALIAVGVFLVLLGSILGFGWLQRRRARAARIARVRAASQLPARASPTGEGSPGRLSRSRDLARSTAARSTAAGSPAAGSPAAAGARPGAGPDGAGVADGPDPWRQTRSDGSAAGTPFESALFARSMGQESPGADGAFGAGGSGAGTSGPSRPVISGVVIGASVERSPGPAGSVGMGVGSGGMGVGSGGPVGAGGVGPVGPVGPVGSGGMVGSGGSSGLVGSGPVGAGGSDGLGGPIGSGAGGVGGAVGGGIAAMRALGPHRMGPRTPRVSGNPPWEPAAEPDGEVPWARSPLPGGGGDGSAGLPQRQPRSEISVWDVIAQEVWPGGPRTDRQDPRSGNSAADPSADAAHEAPRPIYIGNPGATTDTFPAIRPGADGG